MNGQGLAMERRRVGFRLCEVRGCGRLANWGSTMCADCDQMDRELERYWSRQERARRAKYVTRLRTFSLAALFVGLMSWLALEMVPRLWVAYEIWRG